MPARDPITGLPLSGAAKRKAAAARAAAAAAPQSPAAAPPPKVKWPAAGAGPAAPAPVAAAAPRQSADFDRLEPPPLGDSALAIAWANDVLLLALDQVLRDPELKPIERWRWIKDFTAVLGMCRDKAAEQHRLRQLGRSMGVVQPDQPTGGQPLANLQKPPTARRAV